MILTIFLSFVILELEPSVFAGDACLILSVSKKNRIIPPPDIIEIIEYPYLQSDNPLINTSVTPKDKL